MIPDMGPGELSISSRLILAITRLRCEIELAAAAYQLHVENLRPIMTPDQFATHNRTIDRCDSVPPAFSLPSYSACWPS